MKGTYLKSLSQIIYLHLFLIRKVFKMNKKVLFKNLLFIRKLDVLLQNNMNKNWIYTKIENFKEDQEQKEEMQFVFVV